jgi:TolB-like protein
MAYARRLSSLKVLARPDHAGELLKEAQAAAALNHPNIVTIHELGSANGQSFLVMEFLAGETLKVRLKAGPPPLAETLNYAVQIADALSAAHAAGLVHRDIKPGNPMITPEGLVKIMDFGLARLVPKDPDETRTVEHLIKGTPAYMAPEQIRGYPAVEASDIFAFGAVLYEMFSGRQPFVGATVAELMAAILRDDPPPLAHSLPVSLREIVTRCLQKHRSARFSSMLAVKAALLAAKPEGIFGSASRFESSATTAFDSRVSIAVLPFANLSGDKENEYFGVGLAEEILNSLAKLPDWRVASRTSAFRLGAVAQDLQQIGALLNVEYVLEGGVRRAGSRLRVTAQLTKVKDGFQLWSERFDREITHTFDIQDEISLSIVETLRGRLACKAVPSTRATQNLEASQMRRGGINDEQPLSNSTQLYGELYAYRVLDGTMIRLTNNKWEEGLAWWEAPLAGK